MCSCYQSLDSLIGTCGSSVTSRLTAMPSSEDPRWGGIGGRGRTIFSAKIAKKLVTLLPSVKHKNAAITYICDVAHVVFVFCKYYSLAREF
jgi:hypothetical protein